MTLNERTVGRARPCQAISCARRGIRLSFASRRGGVTSDDARLFDVPISVLYRVCPVVVAQVLDFLVASRDSQS